MDGAAVQMFVDEVTKIGKGQVPSRSDDPKDDKKMVTDAASSLLSSHASAPTDDWTKSAEGKMDKKPGDSPDRGVEGGKNWHEPMSGQGKPPPKPTYDVGASPNVVLSDLSPAVGQDEKTGQVVPAVAEEQKKAKDPGFQRLTAIPETTKAAMFDELLKLSVELPRPKKVISEEDARRAYEHLGRLEQSKPAIGELGRGGAVGAVIGPVATLAARAIAGAKGRSGGKLVDLKDVSKGYSLWPGARSITASSGYGAVFGGAMPALRHKLETEAETQKLREYVGEARGGKLRRNIKKTLGV